MPRRVSFRLILIQVALLVLPAADAVGQGFSLVSGRNHPELVWKTAVTDHFEISYPDRLAGIETAAAAIAEASYAALSENFGVSFDERIRIYLSDEDEVANGYAFRAGSGWTNIWVNVNDAATEWTGNEKWMRRVIPHELAHIFHYRAVGSRLGVLDLLFSRPLPRFWTEGIAQYQTEAWDTFRGERWLRTAVLEDRLSYRDGRSVWNGRLLYAVGNSQVRFLASQHGDSTLTKILAFRRPAMLGMFRVHDFDQAFEASVGKKYRDFYDDWRKHVNIYYNTIAGQMSSIDSLEAKRVETPGQYLYDLVAPDGSNELFSHHLESLERPVRRIAAFRDEKHTRNLVEGAIRNRISVSSDGSAIAFARSGRGNAGSIVNDVYLVDRRTGQTRRLTHGRRASSPALSPDGKLLAFVESQGQTANLIQLNLETGAEAKLTKFDGDVQLGFLDWSPSGQLIAYYVFDQSGERRIEIIDLRTGRQRSVTDGKHDDRRPVWGATDSLLAWTSLRDGVPNIFVTNLQSGRSERVTRLANGAIVTDWVSPDSLHPSGQFIVIVANTKREDRAYLIDADLRADSVDVREPAGFGRWVTHRPPRTIPSRVSSSGASISDIRDYNTWKNITHVASLPFPYYNNRDDWGIGGATLWIEPLGKHVFAAVAGLAAPSPIDQSFLAATYINRQLRPTLEVSVTRLPNLARPYGNDVLREDRNEITAAAWWALDWRPQPYLETTVGARLRYIDVKPLNPDDFMSGVDGLPTPAAGQQLSLRVALTRRKLRPYRNNLIHPLDGWGARLRVKAATRDAEFRQSYLRLEASAYRIFPVIGQHRLFVFGRFRGQEGTSLPQDFVGLSRYDAIRISSPGLIDLTFSTTDRVRGYRRVVVGGRTFFGSAEYRIPLVPSLRTSILGLVTLGATTIAPFVDFGAVWSRPQNLDVVYQTGAGIELKNTLRIADLLDVSHAIGFAQPADRLGSDTDHEIYYRIRTALPF